ncbi:MAG: TonB family protein [Desulfuromusa sp.]|nr:TonB family protein [Desulfuromusa sp.]
MLELFEKGGNVRILESSGDKLLDQSAVEAINKASGKTKRPQDTGFKTIHTSAVIKYQYGL